MIVRDIEIDCWIASAVDQTNEISVQLVVDYDDGAREVSNVRFLGKPREKEFALKFLGGHKAACEYLDGRVEAYREANPEEFYREYRNERNASIAEQTGGRLRGAA